MNNMAKNLLLWLLIAAVLLSVFNNFNLRTSTEQVGYSAFVNEVQTDRLSKVVVDGLIISAQRKDGSTFETVRPMVEDPKLMDDLLSHNITVEGKKPEQQSVWTQLLIASFPILLIIAVFMFFMRQMQGGGGGRGGPMSFGKSKASGALAALASPLKRTNPPKGSAANCHCVPCRSTRETSTVPNPTEKTSACMPHQRPTM